jgi:hypothetical protein
VGAGAAGCAADATAVLLGIPSSWSTSARPSALASVSIFISCDVVSEIVAPVGIVLVVVAVVELIVVVWCVWWWRKGRRWLLLCVFVG